MRPCSAHPRRLDALGLDAHRREVLPRSPALAGSARHGRSRTHCGMPGAGLVRWYGFRRECAIDRSARPDGRPGQPAPRDRALLRETAG